jgi:predicted ribosome quality control (RQC) complex YloA/Tae2 family protein
VHNNFYLLRQLSVKLNETIAGYAVVSCFSQSKDELIIELNNTKDSFFIRADLSQTFSCLSFPGEFRRARKNSVDLFEKIILKKVKCVRQFENERAFALELEDGHTLIFKMHGNFANVLLAKENKVKAIFRNHLGTDFEIEVDKLNKSIDFSKENFLKHSHQPASIYFTFGKPVFDYLKEKGFESSDVEGQWKSIQETIGLLENPAYYLVEKNARLTLSLLPTGKMTETFDDPIIAITAFYDKSTRDQAFLAEKKEALTGIQTRLKNSQAYVAKNTQKSIELEHDHHYQLWADLIMANLHVIKQGQEKVVLTSFYDGAPVEIKLKKEMTAQKNAEVFYRKSKNHQLEINKLKESILAKEKDIENFESQIFQVEGTHDLRSLREKMGKLGLVKKSSVATEPLPYREFEFRNYKIWVGKNAEANDTLTLKYSFKDDLWLHAKDVAGSHVLLKHQAGKNFPKEVIEYAAGLAAFYSKRKNETLCPVAFTPKKFVRKRKGDPAGAVVVEREEVILVEPLEAKN